MLVALLVVLVAAFHAGRLFRAEQAITGGEISLPLDDSFIYLQYSKAIAEGHPFVYTKGNAPTTGATSLAYPLLLLPPHLFRMPPSVAIGWTLALGLLGYVLSALLMARIGTRLGGRAGGALALILFLASPFLLWGYMSGMEIALYATVLLVSFRVYLREREAARFPTLRWWLFALATSRPEGAILAGVFGVLMLMDRMRAARRGATPGEKRPAAHAIGLDALLPFAAAALPFLVNLLVSGSIEATSSQAKSILAEPYRETKLSYLTGSPSVWLAISKVYLAMMQVEMVGLRIRHTDLAAINAIGVALFLLFAFVPRHRPWPRGLALVPILAAGVLVNSLPVHWYVHLFRYLQGIYPLVLLVIAAGWGRLASFAREEAPAPVRVLAALLVAAIPLATWAPRLLPEQARIIKFYAHNCENILHQQVTVGRWIDRNLRPDAIVGLNDAGAIAYYGQRQTVDLIGLTSAGYARVYRSGLGCLFEHIRREPPPRLPTYFAVYPGWFPYWRESGILGPESFRAHLGFNTICAAADMMVYPASWVDVAATDRPETQLAGKRLVDSLDLAWLEDERLHEWRAEPEAKDVLRQYVFPDRPTRPLTDGGRIVYGLERFRVRVTPGRDLTMILRTDAWYPSRIRVLVDGKDAGVWDIARADTSWTEPQFTVPGARITGPRPEVTLRREGEGGTQTRSEVPESQSGNLAPFHIWFYQ